jgi:coenzyme F420 hydrogenase subunit beta
MPLCLLSPIPDIIRPSERYAIVGLPCHLQGLQLLRGVRPDLVSGIVLTLGLTCSHAVNRYIFDYVRHKRNRRSKPDSISLAGGGWPGRLEFTFEEEENLRIDRLRSLWSDAFGSNAFTPDYCFRCRDLSAEMSDISFADAWLPRVVRSDAVGSSLLLVRSDTGESLVEEAVARGLIKLTQVDAREYIYSQKTGLLQKKLITGMQFEDADRRRIPLAYRILSVPLILTAGLNRALASSRQGRRILFHIPEFVFRGGRILLKVLSHILAGKFVKNV